MKAEDGWKEDEGNWGLGDGWRDGEIGSKGRMLEEDVPQVEEILERETGKDRDTKIERRRRMGTAMRWYRGQRILDTVQEQERDGNEWEVYKGDVVTKTKKELERKV